MAEQMDFLQVQCFSQADNFTFKAIDRPKFLIQGTA
jgi:hypothetical protein